jgi:hypothetical protein
MREVPCPLSAGTSGMDGGGDWYDVTPTGSGVSLVIGDVEGHSIAAAATMAQLRSAVRAFAAVGHTPGDVMAGVNRTLIDLDPRLLLHPPRTPGPPRLRSDRRPSPTPAPPSQRDDQRP